MCLQAEGRILTMDLALCMVQPAEYDSSKWSSKQQVGGEQFGAKHPLTSQHLGLNSQNTQMSPTLFCFFQLFYNAAYKADATLSKASRNYHVPDP